MDGTADDFLTGSDDTDTSVADGDAKALCELLNDRSGARTTRRPGERRCAPIEQIGALRRWALRTDLAR